MYEDEYCQFATMSRGKVQRRVLTDTRETEDAGGNHSDECEEREDEGRKERGVGG